MAEKQKLSLRALVHKRLGIVDEVQEVEDPWGLGVRLWVKCDDDRAYIEAMAKEANSQATAAVNAMSRRSLRLFRERVTQNGEGDQSEEQLEQALEEAFGDEAATFRAHPDDVAAIMRHIRFGQPRSVAKLVDRLEWPGQGEFDEADVVELLSDTTHLPEFDQDGDAIPYGNQSFGLAWQKFIQETAKARTEARNAAVKVLEKNSPRSSGGSTSGASDSTASNARPSKNEQVVS